MLRNGVPHLDHLCHNKFHYHDGSCYLTITFKPNVRSNLRPGRRLKLEWIHAQLLLDLDREHFLL
jgi:hypothetical protein